MNQPNERHVTAGLVTLLAETFRQKISPELLEAYRIGLEGIDPAALKRAVHAALRTCRFMPTPVELRELAGELKLTDRAVRAFMAMEEAVVKIGGYSTIDFDDRFINATVRALGGWVSVCETPADEFDKFLKQKFERTYCSLVAAGVSLEQAEPLQGRHDRVNSIGGYERQPVKEIITGLPVLANNPPRIEARPGPQQDPMLRLKPVSRELAPLALPPPRTAQEQAEIDVLASEIEAKRAAMSQETQ